MIREAQRLLGEVSARTNGFRVGVPIIVLMTLGMVTLPMPPFMLDALFTFNIALSLLILLVSVYTLRPLDFAVFPTILLVSTLLRLALNVASTRVVLLNGHSGGDAAGKVIQSFGEVVIGNNYVVGLVVFAILVIINFVVVTKGAGRISEVTARFTLDALPGKQMAIDADLNAGIIDQKSASSRRESVRREADFYGSMDGASKFVRGDAMAGLLILAINIIGGMLIGTLAHNLSAGDAFTVYSLLTIGDGLVAQIPSLLLSTAAALMVTRVSESADMGNQVSEQMLSSPKAMILTGTILIVMGLVPGMPLVPFTGLGALVLLIVWWLQRNASTDTTVEENEPDQTAVDTSWSWGDIPPVDAL
ncbi:MAG: FHIPEP family type III secretion protein, partial [Endozoicomonas sp.]